MCVRAARAVEQVLARRARRGEVEDGERLLVRLELLGLRREEGHLPRSSGRCEEGRVKRRRAPRAAA